MPKITSITQQKKLRERYNLFVDGKFEIGVHGSLIQKHGIEVGQEYSESLKLELENDDRVEMAYTGLLNFIAFRERCESEVRDWLFKKKYADLTEELVQRLKDRNYLSDERFARLFMRDRVKIKGWGPVRLRHELAAKRVAKHLIEVALEEIRDEFDFREMARDLADRKLKHLPRPTYKDKKRLWSFLQRRGFEPSAISHALEGRTFYADETDAEDA